ncbi:MAG: hypothetical protein KatS3mg102_2778 [Planctomycetota bacterium]|nr:MAG: hypothetical protein KatS3mg102_2778 [Planctomycetota bacterium]
MAERGRVAGRRGRAWWLALGGAVALAVALPLGGCQDDGTWHGQSAEGGLVSGLARQLRLGEAVYRMVRARLAADPDPARAAARLAALEARRAELVAAVDTILTPASLEHLGPTLAGVVALVDDGTLPALAAELAALLEELVHEPGHATVRALLAVGQARGVLQGRGALVLLGQLLAQPELEDASRALAELIRSNDGRDEQGRPNGEPDLVAELSHALAAVLERAAQPPAAGAPPGLLSGLGSELLRLAPPRDPSAFGAPAWVVRADRHGNPQVATDPARGTLYPPFVDRDGDGAADVDAEGRPVDAAGQPLAIEPFGTPGAPGRDGWGRALAPDGRPLFVYLDAKQTLLSHLLQLLAEGLRRGVHLQVVDVLEAALGPRLAHDGGTPADPSDDWRGFAGDSPAADLIWGALALLEQPQAPALLRALAASAQAEPALTERVLVELGRFVEHLRPLVLRASPAAAPSAQGRQLADRLLWLAGRLMHAGAGPGRRSTGRVLVDVLAQLGHTGRQLPAQLALLLRYRKLELDAAGNAGPGSELVDRAAPPGVAGSGADNRSVLQQLLELLVRADGCHVFGRPLSEMVLELMAGRSVGTVHTLIGLLQNPLARALADAACPGMGADLGALEALRASGALGALLPLARAFVEQDQTRLLVELLAALAQDYELVVRPAEVELADALASGAPAALFDLVELLAVGRNGQPVVDPLTGERVLDVLADGFAELVDHPPGGLAGPRGMRVPSRLHLVLEPLRRTEDALAAQGSAPIVTALLYSLTDLLVERRWNDAGTPADPADDFEELANPSVLPVLLEALERLADNLPAGAAERAARLGALRAEAQAWLRSREAAALFDLALALRHAQAAEVFRLATIRLLTPEPLAADDAFGALLRVGAPLLEQDLDPVPLRQLAGFLSRQAAPPSSRLLRLLEGSSRLLVADRGRLLVQLLRNALLPAPAGSPLGQLAAAGAAGGPLPLETLARVLAEVRAAGGSAGAPAASGAAGTEPRLAAALEGIQAAIALIRDEQGGLGWLFRWVATRGRAG